MKKHNHSLRIVYGIAGGLAVVAAVLLLFVCLFSDGVSSGSKEGMPTELSVSVGDTQFKTESETAGETMTETANAPESSVPSNSSDPTDSSDSTDSSDPTYASDFPEQSENVEPSESQESGQTGFRLTIVGDTYYNERRVENYKNQGIDGLLSKELYELMQNADIAVLNNECALSDGGTPMENKEYTYRMTPSLADSYVEMGIDVVTLANNHALDFGTTALSDTFDTLDRIGVEYIGAGEDLDRAKRAAVFEAGGKKIAILAASRVIPVVQWNVVNRTPGMFCTYDSTALEQEIRACAEECDYVIVYVHWGIMETPQPKEYQQKMAYRFIDAGADAVFGTHPHVVQSIEFYQGKPICYSLGNFLYGSTIARTMLVEIAVDETGEWKTKLYPCEAKSGTTRLMPEEKQAEFYQYMESISYSIEIDENGYVKESRDGRRE